MTIEAKAKEYSQRPSKVWGTIADGDHGGLCIAPRDTNPRGVGGGLREGGGWVGGGGGRRKFFSNLWAFSNSPFHFEQIEDTQVG